MPSPHKEIDERWDLSDGKLKCPICNYFTANIWLWDNNTAYPNCGDQTCVSGFMWDHPGLLKKIEEEYIRYMEKMNICLNCGREKGCNADCEDMNCEHCYCYREGRDG